MKRQIYLNLIENIPLYAAGAFFQNTGLGTDD